FTDEQLLEVRMCDLGVTIEGTDLEARIAQLNTEMDARGLTFRPYYWLSDEWFTPDGVPGIAIPFYLAHPRLAKLEFAQMLEVEGGDPEECMRILRHEVGHAIDNAYTLRRRPRRRRLFGHPGIEYPEYYRPKPDSKSYVGSDSAARGGARHRQRLHPAAAAAATTAVRSPRDRVSRVLHAQTVQQELRPAPRSLVRAEPPRRGFRRNVRRLARPE